MAITETEIWVRFAQAAIRVTQFAETRSLHLNTEQAAQVADLMLEQFEKRYEWYPEEDGGYWSSKR
jgi:hypothetical protein